jgi:hypothetical protein
VPAVWPYQFHERMMLQGLLISYAVESILVLFPILLYDRTHLGFYGLPSLW